MSPTWSTGRASAWTPASTSASAILFPTSAVDPCLLANVTRTFAAGGSFWSEPIETGDLRVLAVAIVFASMQGGVNYSSQSRPGGLLVGGPIVLSLAGLRPYGWLATRQAPHVARRASLIAEPSKLK